MSKTETNVNVLKINRGTYANIQTNLSSIGENELIITTDKNVPVPTTNDDGKVIKVNASGEYELGTVASGYVPDADVTVEIESNYSSTDYTNRTSYATAISLQEFIANCEAGNVYTNAGIIAKVNNMISGKAFRIILIGTNHEVLAYDDTTQTKTTWQFLDMPEHNVRLGLPINLLDWADENGGGSGKQYLNEYLNGINSLQMYLYPSNMGGLIEAAGLLESAHTIFESLPETLKRHIKTVRRKYNRKRNCMTVGANGGAETNVGEFCEIACNVFHLAGADLGAFGQSGEGSGSQYSYLVVGNANRKRYYNGTAAHWWTASPSPNSSNSSYDWGYVKSNGSTGSNSTGERYAVAPAFCI